MHPAAFPRDAEAALLAIGWRPGRRLTGARGTERWHVVSHDGTSACAAEILTPGDLSAEIEARIEVLTTLRHPHLAATYRLVRTDRGSGVLLHAEVDGIALRDLARLRQQWEPGEVVTLVAPIADALAALHGAGLVHGAVGPDSVTIALDGRPVLCELLAVDAPRVVPAAADDDVAALARLGLNLLAPAASPLRDVLEEVIVDGGRRLGAEPPADTSVAEALAVACHGACPPLPLRLPPLELLAARSLAAGPGRPRTTPPGSRLVRPRATGPGEAGRSLTRRSLASRRSLAVAATVGAVGLATALLLGHWPSGASDTAVPGTAVPGTAVPGTAVSNPAVSNPAVPGTAAPAASPSDPVRAARALTAARDAAVADLDARSLASVTVDGSPARATDAAFLARLRETGVRLDGFATRIVALAALGDPAPGEDGRATARVLLTSSTSAYRQVGPDGAVVRSVPASRPSQVVLVLRWTGDDWRVSDVEAASQ